MATLTQNLSPQARRDLIKLLASARAAGEDWSAISERMARSAEVTARSLYADMLNGLHANAPAQYALVAQTYAGNIDKWLKDTASAISAVEAHTPPERPDAGATLTPEVLLAAKQRLSGQDRYAPEQDEELARQAGLVMGRAIANRIDNPPPPEPLPPDPTVVILRALHWLVRVKVAQLADAYNYQGAGMNADAKRCLDAGQDVLAELTTALEIG